MSGDRILIRGLEFVGRHGVFEHERREGCRFRADVELDADLGPSAASDRLADTINYASVAETIIAIGTGPSFRLLERLSQAVCSTLLEHYPIRAVELRLQKLDPPVAGQPECVGIFMRREAPQ